MFLSVSGTIIMDEMNVLPGEGTADDPRVLMRDPIGWRAAVFGRLGTAAIKTTFLERHQQQETAFLKKELSHPRREVEALHCVCVAPNDATPTARGGTMVREGSAPAPKPATLSP